MSVQSQSTIADQTFAKAESVAAGEGSPGDLIPLLDQLIPAARKAREEFLDNSRDNPEIHEDMANNLAQAMEDYTQALEAMRGQAEGGDLEALQASLAVADEKRWLVRAAQASFQQFLEQGVTIHPQLNRILLHIEYFVREGQERRHTLALLSNLPNVFAEIKGNMSVLEDPAVLAEAESALDDLESRCEEFSEAVKSDWAGLDDRPAFLQNLHEEIIAASDRLANVLAAQLQQDLAVDRTPLAPVNLVLALADRLIEKTATPEQFVEGLVMADRLLVMQVPEGADEVLVEQVNQVRELFERMANLANDPNPDQLRAEKEVLTSAAQNLAMFAAVLAADDENLLDFTHGEGVPAGGGGGGHRGLPTLLSSLLNTGESFIEGGATREALEEGIQGLDQLITRTKAQAAGARDVGQGKQLQETLAHLQTASEAMWSLSESDNPQAVLGQAEQAMIAAAETLKTVAAR